MSGLEQEFSGKVKAYNLDATTDESKQAISGLGFQNHGLVIRSAQGELLFKQPDHQVKMEEVRAKLQELTRD